VHKGIIYACDHLVYMLGASHICISVLLMIDLSLMCVFVSLT
jgi:hypothetical protein